MAQSVVHQVLSAEIAKQLLASNLSVAVAQSGNTALLEFNVARYTRVWVQVAVTGQDLDAFVVQGKLHPDGGYITLASTAAHYTSPSGIVYGASGDLTVLAASATGWIALDVTGLDAVKILASSGNVAGSTVSAYAAGR